MTLALYDYGVFEGSTVTAVITLAHPTRFRPVYYGGIIFVKAGDWADSASENFIPGPSAGLCDW